VGEALSGLDDEALLAEEAHARGLHRTDPLVRRRLVRNMRFLLGVTEGSDSDPGDDALFEEALALGMDRSDLVVRRRLAQRITLGIESVARSEAPNEAELEAYLASHAERFLEPETIELSQIHLSRDRRGEALVPDAQRLLARLGAEAIPPEQAAGLGDPSLLSTHQPPRSLAELARTFGEEFARAVDAGAPGAWFGPVPSSYGLHLVWVRERRPARLPSLDEVRSAVRESLLADRAEAAVREAVRALRDGGSA